MKIPEKIENYRNYFSVDKFWSKVKGVAKKIGVKSLYYTLLLYYAMMGDNVSKEDRNIILGALGYLILPLDLLPDFIPAAGLTDDVAVLALALVKVMRNITPETKAKAEAMLHEFFPDYNRDDLGVDLDIDDVKTEDSEN